MKYKNSITKMAMLYAMASMNMPELNILKEDSKPLIKKTNVKERIIKAKEKRLRKQNKRLQNINNNS